MPLLAGRANFIECEQADVIRRQIRHSRFGLALLGLWAAALVLALTGLGGVPLRDWDESLVARVALELSQRPWGERLLPTLWGAPYLNKPPGLHWLIAGAIDLWRGWNRGAGQPLPPEAVVRLVPALIAAALPPLLALVQQRLRPERPGAALASGAIALSLLPLARHGHLAMLDGSQLVAMALLWLALLSARPGGGGTTLAWGVVAGGATSGLLLLKAPVAPPVLAVALLLRALDRELDGPGWRVLGLGLGLGLLPGLGWHGYHLLARGEAALHMWGNQGMARLTSSLERHQGGAGPPLIQVLSGGWPWLPLWPAGLAALWRRRQRRDGRWSLGLTLLASALVLPLQTQLPWYSLLLWPPFALVCGPVLAQLVAGRLAPGLTRAVSSLWQGLGALLLLLVLLSQLPGLPQTLRESAPLALPAAAGLLLGGRLLGPPMGAGTWRRRGALLLLVGWCGSLLLLFAGPQWNWELNEQAPVAPLIPLVRPGPGQPLPLLVADAMGDRPSLAWYAARLPQPWPLRPGRQPAAVFELLIPTGASASALDAARRCAPMGRAPAAGWDLWRCRTAGPR
ncbi:MAG: hypothetical protein VKM01_00230 [Cyanobacteriota bacterium]|nr:hypothetical protein [Cyanobacteriota bacterium]